ncbi:unnamed protein product [Hanseniaspora opuntiae]
MHVFSFFFAFGDFSNSADLNVLEINFKEVLDICFTHIGYDEAGTLSLRKYIPNPSRVIKERTPCNNVSSYQQGKHNTIVPDSLMRGSVSLSSFYGDTSIDSNVEELQVKKEDVFDSYPISHSYYNYTRQVKEPFDPKVLKSVKFIEELKSNSYTLSDLGQLFKRLVDINTYIDSKQTKIFRSVYTLYAQ